MGYVHFEDLRHQETTSVGLRRVGQSVFPRQRRNRDILPKDIVKFDSVGHRLDVFGVDFVQDLDVFEDAGQLVGHPVQLFGREFQPPQQGDFGDFVAGEPAGHRLSSAWSGA